VSGRYGLRDLLTPDGRAISIELLACMHARPIATQRSTQATARQRKRGPRTGEACSG